MTPRQDELHRVAPSVSTHASIRAATVAFTVPPTPSRPFPIQPHCCGDSCSSTSRSRWTTRCNRAHSDTLAAARKACSLSPYARFLLLICAHLAFVHTATSVSENKNASLSHCFTSTERPHPSASTATALPHHRSPREHLPVPPQILPAVRHRRLRDHLEDPPHAVRDLERRVRPAQICQTRA